MLLSSNETKRVESKYRENPLYVVLRGVALNKTVDCELYLKPAELFYLVIETLDQIKGKDDHNECLEYLKLLHNDIKQYLEEKVSDHEDWLTTVDNVQLEKALSYAASLVTNGVMNCLRIADHHRWWYEIDMLRRYDPIHQRGEGLSMFKQYQDLLKKLAVDNFLLWIRDYLSGNDCISDAIEEMVKQFRKEEAEKKLSEEILKHSTFKDSTVYMPNSKHEDHRKVIVISESNKLIENE